ncbi:MAG TPA: PH domain-containing protein [Nitrospira sp.]|nr:PH domain-containing protein [Nitrospira sp.]
MLWVTTLLLVLPIALLVGAFFAGHVLFLAALILIVVYAWVWLRFRPRRFVVDERSLTVIWPLKQCAIPRTDISSARLIDREELRREAGASLRLGAGGLWGGFGWLWTQRRGIVQIYASRTDLFIWIERANGRPWIVTPEQPENFIRALFR